MATPKRARFEDHDVTVKGFVHNVSPIKESQKGFRYFNLILQTGKKEYHYSVCFVSDKYESFIKFNTEKSPVKITNCEKVQSRKPNGEYDIRISKKTLLEKFEVPFQIKAPPTTALIKISALNSDCKADEIINLSAKVMSIDSGAEKLTKNGPMLLYSAVIGDDTGTIIMTFWAQCRHLSAVKVDKSYEFIDLRMCEFHAEKTVMLGNASELTEITNLETVHMPVTESSSTEIQGEISMVAITQLYGCRKCNTNLDYNGRDQTIKCTNGDCYMRQRATDLTKKFNAKIELNSSYYNLPSQVITDFFDQIGKKEMLDDLEEVENYLMTIKVIAKISSRSITNLSVSLNP